MENFGVSTGSVRHLWLEGYPFSLSRLRISIYFVDYAVVKLIDMEALGLTRLAVIMLDMQTDVKGYSLFTLPRVRDELWGLYKNYLHPRLVQGDLRICLYGLILISSKKVYFEVCDSSEERKTGECRRSVNVAWFDKIKRNYEAVEQLPWIILNENIMKGRNGK
ncbi:hypothetical protein HYC85_009689 [Camellia sinensis]|uniref:Uncharacterized protein n=1 Tax=Camellia sinensis TaxID=4442 RepID=A0A7J7HGL8_CAMSI|nr:hypothetical protein HYC85_009689 [Camellia sinensis]